MGDFFNRQYDNAKKMALDAIRYSKKDNEVIDKGKQEVVSDDSSIEQVELIGDNVKIAGQRNLQPSSSSVVTEFNNARKMIHSQSLSPDGVEALDDKAYESLLQDAERRTAKLNILKLEAELNEKRRQALQTFTRPKKLEEKPLEKVPNEPFVPLTKEELKEVRHAFSANWGKVLVTHENSDIDVTGQTLQCLRPRAWLNDEVINMYLDLLKEREGRESKKFLRCHYFNTFFYIKLIGSGNGYNYKGVREWTSTERQLGYFLDDCDKIFVPIHQEVHWCLAVINKKDQKLQYLDSLKGKDENVLHVLARYFIEEVKDKRGEDIDLSSWEYEYVEDLPEQMNGFDCGMFMLKYIDFYSRDIGLCFDQSHMPYFRLRTAKEILRLRAD